MDLLPALPMSELSFLLLLLAEVAMGGNAASAPSSPGHSSIFLPSSTVRLTSPDLQHELILPSLLEQQKIQFLLHC